MSQYTCLLLIIDPALRDSPAITHAAALARASGATLHIVALATRLKIFPLVQKDVWEKAQAASLQGHRDWLTQQDNNLQALGLKVTTQVEWADDLKQNILDYVTEMKPDLLIKQVQQESALKRAFFTPLDWQLLRESTVPVYLIGAAGHALPHIIVAAVDASDTQATNSDLNDRIVEQANAMALQCGAELHLLYACDISALYMTDMGGLAVTDLMEDLQSTEKDRFFELAQRYGVPPDRHHFVLGSPVSALSHFAIQEGVDVIVMGRVRYRGLEKLLGSTTEHILYQVPCSILAV